MIEACWIPRSKSADPLYRFVKGGKAGDPGLYQGSDFPRDSRLRCGKMTTSGGRAHPFSDGLARIEANRKTGFIGRTGEFVIPPRFLAALDFANGMARVVLEGPCTYGQTPPCTGADRAAMGIAGRSFAAPIALPYFNGPR